MLAMSLTKFVFNNVDVDVVYGNFDTIRPRIKMSRSLIKKQMKV